MLLNIVQTALLLNLVSDFFRLELLLFFIFGDILFIEVFCETLTIRRLLLFRLKNYLPSFQWPLALQNLVITTVPYYLFCSILAPFFCHFSIPIIARPEVGIAFIYDWVVIDDGLIFIQTESEVFLALTHVRILSLGTQLDWTGGLRYHMVVEESCEECLLTVGAFHSWSCIDHFLAWLIQFEFGIWNLMVHSFACHLSHILSCLTQSQTLGISWLG